MQNSAEQLANTVTGDNGAPPAAAETTAPPESTGTTTAAPAISSDGTTATSPWDAALAEIEKTYEKPATAAPTNGAGEGPSLHALQAEVARLNAAIAQIAGGREDARHAPQQPAGPQPPSGRPPNPAEDPEGYHAWMAQHYEARFAKHAQDIESRLSGGLHNQTVQQAAALTEFAVTSGLRSAMLDPAYPLASHPVGARVIATQARTDIGNWISQNQRVPTEADIRGIVARAHADAEALIAEGAKRTVAQVRDRAKTLSQAPAFSAGQARASALKGEREKWAKSPPKSHEEMVDRALAALEMGP